MYFIYVCIAICYSMYDLLAGDFAIMNLGLSSTQVYLCLNIGELLIRPVCSIVMQGIQDWIFVCL